jgi:hypothetical protein
MDNITLLELLIFTVSERAKAINIDSEFNRGQFFAFSSIVTMLEKMLKEEKEK